MKYNIALLCLLFLLAGCVPILDTSLKTGTNPVNRNPIISKYERDMQLIITHNTLVKIEDEKNLKIIKRNERIIRRLKWKMRMK